MGEVLEKYGIRTKANFGSLVQEKLQDSELCGLYAIYFAHVIFSKVSSKYLNDFHILKFFAGFFVSFDNQNL